MPVHGDAGDESTGIGAGGGKGGVGEQEMVVGTVGIQ